MTEEKKKAKSKFSFLYIVFIAIAVYFGASLLMGPKVEKVDLEYSEFLSYIKEGKVKDVIIGNELIEGTLIKKGDGKSEKSEFRTAKVDDPGLVKLLNENGIVYSGKFENTFLVQLLLWLPLLLILGLFWFFMMKRMGSGPDFMAAGRSKAKIYSDEQVKTSFSDVAGVDEAEEELTEVIEFLKRPEKFQRLGGKIPKGILLVGSPGTGKTLLARAVAGEAGVPFFSISGSEFVEMFVGVGAARVRDLFSQAQAKAPCIIFIDELDALGKARGGNISGGHDEREQTLNQLLVEMDGFDSRKGLILMSATNRPEILDPALLRPGRFDRHVLVDKPDKKGRFDILRIHSKELVLSDDVHLEKIAAKTPGFVGADLANIANEAALLAARAGKDAVYDEDFDEAIERVVAGLEKKNRLMNLDEKKRVAYHEVGHALVASNLPGTDPVEKISIVPRGLSALGYTLQLPTEDRYLMTESELKKRLATLLGGRVAEEIIFNEPSTGAQNDLMKATDIARSMVTEYGMSKKIGLVSFERNAGPTFLGIAGMERAKEFSDDTSREIDNEIRKLITAAYDEANKILINENDRLVKMAERLLEVEVLEDEELYELLGKSSKKKKKGEAVKNGTKV